MSLDVITSEAPLVLTNRGERYATLTNEYLALASLALKQRELSWVSRHRAAEAEAEAKLDDYRYFAKEARRLWREAIWHLWAAQERKAARDV